MPQLAVVGQVSHGLSKWVEHPKLFSRLEANLLVNQVCWKRRHYGSRLVIKTDVLLRFFRKSLH